MYALISSDLVIQISEKSFDVHPSLNWVAVPSGQNIKVGWSYENDSFSAPPGPDLPTAQSTQNQVLSLACQQQIVSGFTSSALGSAYSYGSNAVDQRNILMAAQSTKGGLLSCQNPAGVWVREAHTQAQAQQVAEDFVAVSDAARAKLNSLQAQINAATTVAAVQGVVWEAENG